MRVIAVANQKGGVGKTTSAANIANTAAAAGRRVLLVDLDPQGSATRLTDAVPRQGQAALGSMVDLTVSDALYATQSGPGRDLEPSKLHQVTVAAGEHWDGRLQVAPANQDLAQRGAETWAGADKRLAASLEPRPGEPAPDLVVIDCPPTLGSLVAAGLYAADDVLVVTEAADGSVEGLPLMVGAIAEARARRGDQGPQLRGIIVTNLPAREQRATQLLELLRDQYGEQVWETIPRRAVVRQAEGAGAPLSAYGRDGTDVTEVYERITARILADLPITEGAH